MSKIHQNGGEVKNRFCAMCFAQEVKGKYCPTCGGDVIEVERMQRVSDSYMRPEFHAEFRVIDGQRLKHYYYPENNEVNI
jgi:hypothetical protein